MARPDPEILAAVRSRVAAALAAKDGLVFVGICGAQGSGKSTLAQALAAVFDGSAILSIDDLYKTKADRIAMAAAVHPLFRTRGVPGTHDVALGRDVIDALACGKEVRLPRFDKAQDDRVPATEWPVATGVRLLILEGWMVGARPQDEAALAAPINALERVEDPAGIWRRHANAALADYRALWARIDLLVLLAAPGFDVVESWRRQQEHDLRARTGGGMRDDEIARFIAHYERLTRHILATMPGYADLVLPLDAGRRLRAPR